MSDIKDITDTEFNELLEHIDLEALDVVKSCTDRWDMLEEQLSIVLVPTDDTLSRLGMAHL